MIGRQAIAKKASSSSSNPDFCISEPSTSVFVYWRRRWDSNPRKVALHTLSKRAGSAALALLHTEQKSGL